MAGQTIQLVRKATFDFTSMQAFGVLEIYYPPAVDCSQFREGTLVARVHSCTIDAGAQIYINTYPRAPTQEDPAFDLIEDQALAATISFNSSTVAPAMKQVLVQTTKLPSAVIVIVAGDQPNPPVTLTAVLSIDLILKS
jgi:hypothetical protein